MPRSKPGTCHRWDCYKPIRANSICFDHLVIELDVLKSIQSGMQSDLDEVLKDISELETLLEK